MDFVEKRAVRLSRVEAAAYLQERHGLKICPATLAQYAHLGTGPVYQRVGRAATYELARLDQWAMMRSSQASAAASDLRGDAMPPRHFMYGD
jgi:hypothetical protein